MEKLKKFLESAVSYMMKQIPHTITIKRPQSSFCFQNGGDKIYLSFVSAFMSNYVLNAKLPRFNTKSPADTQYQRPTATNKDGRLRIYFEDVGCELYAAVLSCVYEGTDVKTAKPIVFAVFRISEDGSLLYVDKNIRHTQRNMKDIATYGTVDNAATPENFFSGAATKADLKSLFFQNLIEKLQNKSVPRSLELCDMGSKSADIEKYLAMADREKYEFYLQEKAEKTAAANLASAMLNYPNSCKPIAQIKTFSYFATVDPLAPPGNQKIRMTCPICKHTTEIQAIGQEAKVGSEDPENIFTVLNREMKRCRNCGFEPAKQMIGNTTAGELIQKVAGSFTIENVPPGGLDSELIMKNQFYTMTIEKTNLLDDSFLIRIYWHRDCLDAREQYRAFFSSEYALVLNNNMGIWQAEWINTQNQFIKKAFDNSNGSLMQSPGFGDFSLRDQLANTVLYCQQEEVEKAIRSISHRLNIPAGMILRKANNRNAFNLGPLFQKDSLFFAYPEHRILAQTMEKEHLQSFLNKLFIPRVVNLNEFRQKIAEDKNMRASSLCGFHENTIQMAREHQMDYTDAAIYDAFSRGQPLSLDDFSLIGNQSPDGMGGFFDVQDLLDKTGLSAAECIRQVREHQKETWAPMQTIAMEWLLCINEIQNVGGTQVPLNLDNELVRKSNMAKMVTRIDSVNLCHLLKNENDISVDGNGVYARVQTKYLMFNHFYKLRAYEYLNHLSSMAADKRMMIMTIRADNGDVIGFMSTFISNIARGKEPISFSLWTDPKIDAQLKSEAERVMEKWKPIIYNWISVQPDLRLE